MLSIKLTEYYGSTEQTITAAGSLQLTHSLGTEPLIIQCLLICKTSENNYSVDDKVFINHGQMSSDVNNNYGVSIVPDSTYLNIRFGSATGVFNITDKTTGAGVGITAANWKFIVRAWA